MPQETSSFTFAPGARPIPDHHLLALLGRGGFGEVWSASGPGNIKVALKFVPLAGRAGDAELRALEVIRDVRHPNLLGLHGVWEANGYLILGQELGDRTLMDRLKEAIASGFPGVPADEALDYMADAARGLDHLNHQLDIQHRDVKPQNLFLLGGGVKVADFGLAKAMRQAANTTTTGGMTPAYAPKELFEGKVTKWTDQYSLAVTYVQLRSGRLPFEGSQAEVMAGHMLRPPDLWMIESSDERDVLFRALAKVPEQRWPNCRAFVDVLRQAVTSGLGIPAGFTPPRNQDAPPPGASLWSLPTAGPDFQPTPLATPVPTTPGPAAASAPAVPVLAFAPKTARRRWLLALVLVAAGVGLAVGLAALPFFHTRESVEPVANTTPGRSGLLDCTGPDGASDQDLKNAQQRWAELLGRAVEESVDLGKGVAMRFVLVPPGQFLMGSPADEADRGADERLHPVVLTAPYYLGKFEVTQAEYEAVAHKNPSQFRGADLPVEQVSWDECVAFAHRLTAKAGRGWVYRLPTEAEWEYACRAGRANSRPFGVGDGRSLSSALANVDGTRPYGGAAPGPDLGETCRVGSYEGNRLGLHDMHGNVWEWCGDWSADYPGGQRTDPGGPASGSGRVYRGGGWYGQAKFARAAFRNRAAPAYRSTNLGFRVARIPAPPGK